MRQAKKHTQRGYEMYTLEQVKNELPAVKVKFKDGSIFDGIITGRNCKFPKVSVKMHGTFISIEYCC